MNSIAVGLRILTSESSSTSGWPEDSSNVVINYGVKSIKPVFEMNQSQRMSTDLVLGDSGDSGEIDPPCFLKSCFLCTKILRLDEDVYMYRGDQGFCSEVCRNRQIYVDEMREIEKSTKQTLASFRCCRNSRNWCNETNKLLGEFRHPRWCEQSISGQMGRTPGSIFTFS